MKTLVAMATTRSHSHTMVKCLSSLNSFSYDQMFLKLADKVDMDDTLNEFKNTVQIRSLILDLRPLDC